MPQYNSLYDLNPLPDPGSASSDPGEPAEAAVPKRLSVQWSGPQPLHTVTPPPLGSKGTNGGNGSGGSGTSGSGGHGGAGNGGDGKPPAGPPVHHKVHVRPDDLLVLEQRLLDLVTSLAANYNTLAANAEQATTEEWWGQEEGSNVVQHSFPGETPQQHLDNAGIENTPHYVYSDFALSAQKFLAQLRMNQRGALQHAADIVTLTGGFIAALNATADVYGQADQYSVFPDKSQLAQGGG
jgi:hypothetical protein